MLAEQDVALERRLLGRMLVSHAYRELLAVQRFGSAVELAPTPALAEYVRRCVAEEAGHYAGCKRVAASLGLEIESAVRARLAQEPAGIPPMREWLDFLLAQSFNDRAGYYVMRGLTGSRIAEYSELAREIVDEEGGHSEHGVRLLVEHWKERSLSLALAQPMLSLHLRAAVRCLGSPRSDADRHALRLGLKTRSAEETGREFLADARHILRALEPGAEAVLDDALRADQ